MVGCLTVLEFGDARFSQVAKVMIFEQDVLATFVVDRIFGLSDAGLVVFPNGGRPRDTDAKFCQKMAEVDDRASGIESSDLLRFSGRLGDYGLKIGRPVDGATSEVYDIPGLAATLVFIASAKAPMAWSDGCSIFMSSFIRSPSPPQSSMAGGRYKKKHEETDISVEL